MRQTTLTERAKLIEAAFRSHNPQAFLTGLQAAFRYDGRLMDFFIAAELCELFQQREIEKLMYRKIRWQSGPAVKS